MRDVSVDSSYLERLRLRVDPKPTVDLATPVIIGHRGMGISHRNSANPHVENTRASFIAAHQSGAAWVELDVLPSADGDLMLFHDHFITINGQPTPIWSVPTQRLLDAGMERLDGLCDDLPDGLGLYLEAKVVPGDSSPFGPSSVPALTQWAQAHVTHRPIMLASFDPFVVADMHTSGVTSAWIGNESSHTHTTVMAAVRAGLQAVVLHGDSLDRPAHEQRMGFEMAREHGVAIWCWSPTLHRIPYYRDLGVTGFCVDEVAEAVSLLGSG